ncbi:hypothetical protein NQ318_014527, partial [Aromia moschata]
VFKMTTVTIKGVPVNFPFEPYDLQKDYMEKSNETNGVLESPTGTGKTLSLLCSSLAWLQLKKAQLQMQRQTAMCEQPNDYISSLKIQLEKTAGKTSGRSFLGLPIIIYASRTHSQLSQAMQELKRTSYSHMKACILGSREVMCIHPELISEQNNSRHMCDLKVKTRNCFYYNQVERKKLDPAISELSIIDIEDILKLGDRHKFCPYFMTKELRQHADIIFMPYNYLLDPLARKALGLELSNSIVILDEAHNIERNCEEAASLQIKSSDIALAIEELTGVMKVLGDEAGAELFGESGDILPEDLCILKEILLNFEKEMDSIELTGGPEGTNFDGNYIFEILSNAGVKANNFNKTIHLISNIIQFLTTVGDGPFARKGNGLQLFEDFLTIVFGGVTEEFKNKVKLCYKVHIVEEEIKKKKPDNWLSKATTKSSGRVLSYWCFNPGFGMDMLMGENLKSLILTSGTLAPLRPLITELGLNVQVRLENPHIVKGDQICVKIISSGPDTEMLNSNFKNRDNPKYMGSLGRSVLNLCRVIPHGLLIFFPSYPTMEKCAQYWQECGLWSNICQLKPILMEPRDKNTFNNAIAEYYAKIKDPALKGAIFMGVCRGKVSEGLDFADANGRAVILTGLPYPPLKDPKVILKKRYLDKRNADDKEFLRGDEWYSLEATRAVNQAIGRVIRHRNDYGAILLLDTKFNYSSVKNHMSRWLRDHIKTVNNFGEAMRDLRIFFKNAEAKFPTSDHKTKSAPASSTPCEFDVPAAYKKNNFDFSTSSIASASTSSTTESLNGDGEVVIHKRVSTCSLTNTLKGKKSI